MWIDELETVGFRDIFEESRERNEFDVSCVNVNNSENAVAAARKVFPYCAPFYSKRCCVFMALNFRYDAKFNILINA